MPFDAIIFDLFGTLVDNFPAEAFEVVLSEMAKVLNAPRAEFAHLWNVDTWPLRATGRLPTTEANIEYICQALGVLAEREQVSAAARLRFDFTRRFLNEPRPDAAPTLSSLKSAGYKIGLISDCSSEVPLLWSDMPLAPLIDVPIFSCAVGLKKPDARIYLLACERLGVLPQRCLYTGDGGSHELSGATAVGMHPVLIRVPYESSDMVERHGEEEWNGRRIAAISEVLAYVNNMVAGLDESPDNVEQTF
jgi:putative hydrolase of the HAD superfamily